MSLRERIRSLERKAQLLQRLKRSAEISRSVPEDPVLFFRKTLGFEPTAYQKKLAKDFARSQFIAARWCRQSGKSYTIAALLLWFALKHPAVYVAIIGPSFRQSKLIIRKIAGFLPKIDRDWYLKPLKTKIEFTHGSRVEAFPNNPDTIRGPTLHVVYADEFNFVRDDEDLYDAILFTLGTTNGKFICSSTPWSRDSVFYKICNHPDFEDFKRHHVTWHQAVEPKGPLKRNILEKIKKQLASDPWRWRREMMAEWAEDEDAFFPQDLITRCIGTEKAVGSELEFIPEDLIVSKA